MDSFEKQVYVKLQMFQAKTANLWLVEMKGAKGGKE